jgi:hypothetical protein
MRTSTKLITIAATALSCACALSWASPANAQSGHVTTTEEAYVPNRYLLTSGLVLWGVPYTIGVVQASQSSYPSDQHLYVPIVGPWLDLNERTPCSVANNACNGETTSKVLLVADGVFQAIGTIEVVWAFLRPEHRSITTVSSTRYTPAITLAPTRVASGYGLTALARF